MQTRDAPLNIAVLGVDDRLRTTLKMFFQGPCKSNVVMVATDSAEASIIDMDGLNADSLYNENRERFPDHPLILLSLRARHERDAFYVQKPIQASQMQAALEDIRALLEKRRHQVTTAVPAPEENPQTGVEPFVMESEDSDIVEQTFYEEETVIEESISYEDYTLNQPESVLDVDLETGLDADFSTLTESYADVLDKPQLEEEARKSMKVVTRAVKSADEVHRAAHRAAMHLDEDSYSDFVGSVPDIDPENPQQVAAAHYDPKTFLQGYVQSAYSHARSKNRILRLNTGWKPIIIFPHSHEIWVDAEDEELRGLSIVPVSSISDFDNGSGSGHGITIGLFNHKLEGGKQNPEKFQSMEAFMWKLALWSSAGRVPQSIDLTQPVFLKRWPNLSRLVLVPHSLRIAALLVEQPRSLLNVAEVLGIRQQYVFSFFSAAHALGIASQSSQRSTRTVAAVSRKKKNTGFLGKILKRLRH